jgi:BirA family biotin operon repressor/biotin-[acetyl-CoA-carboxylase] ligase
VLEFAPLPADVAVALAREQSRLAPHVGEALYVPSVTSTMDVAAALAEAGRPHGLVVVAGQQTAGRGRRGHAWVSPAGSGLYLSLVIRPPVTPFVEGVPSVLGLMTLAAGLAVAEGIGQATGLEASLKWPNDLFYGYKLAGVLAEGHHLGTDLQHVIVGVGINVLDAPDLGDGARATSLARELGAPPDAGTVLAEVLAAWSARYQDLLDGRFARVVDRWRIRATGLAGRPVSWVDARGEREGTTTGVDATGALLVDTGVELVRITSGAVTWQ